MSTTTKNYGFVKPELTDVANIAATNENWDKVDEHVGKLYDNVDDLEQQAENLDLGKAKISSKSENFESAHIKDVPNTAAPYAEVVEIGGMTYKDGNTLRSATVTEVESVGVNLFDFETWKAPLTMVGCAISVGDGSFTITPSTNDAYVLNNGYLISVKPNQTYTLKFNRSNHNVTSRNFVFFGNGTNTSFHGGLCTFTVPEDTNIINIRFGIVNSSTAVTFSEIRLTEGATEQPYTPYIHHTITIPEAVRNLDGYGWGVNESVYNYIDYKKKQFVKRVGCVDLGTCTYVMGDNGTVNYAYSNDFRAKPRGIVLANFPTSIIGCYADDIGRVIFTSALGYYDAATFKAALSGVMLYYELAEPIITDISDLLPADNLIGVEGGGTVRMVNEYGYDVPTKIVFCENTNKIVGAKQFVGELIGTAGRAICDEHGNVIHESYVRKSGDTMTGDLVVIKNGTASVRVTNTSTSRRGTFQLDGKTAYVLNGDLDSTEYFGLSIDNTPEKLTEKLRFINKGATDPRATIYMVFGTHNKPNGSYTGNGSSTSRTVAVGGIGEVLTITSDNGMALVTNRGAICLDRQAGTVSGLKSYEVNYQNGVLTIATTSAFINGSSVSYWYQVL